MVDQHTRTTTGAWAGVVALLGAIGILLGLFIFNLLAVVLGIAMLVVGLVGYAVAQRRARRAAGVEDVPQHHERAEPSSRRRSAATGR